MSLSTQAMSLAKTTVNTLNISALSVQELAKAGLFASATLSQYCKGQLTTDTAEYVQQVLVDAGIEKAQPKETK